MAEISKSVVTIFKLSPVLLLFIGAAYATWPFWLPHVTANLPEALKEPFKDPRLDGLAERLKTLEELAKERQSTPDAIQDIKTERARFTEELKVLLERMNALEEASEPIKGRTTRPTDQNLTQHILATAGLDLGEYHALVIGNNAYGSLAKLNTAVRDAKIVGELLQNSYGFNTRVLLNADRDDILDAFNQLRQGLSERDNLLIYYAGHGHIDTDADRGYWLPVDADPSLNSNWLSNADVTDVLKAIHAKRVMVVADSCYSGTLTRSTPRGVKVEPRNQDFIARMLGKTSRTVLASGGLEPVVDSGGSGHSVFAKAFLDALRDNKGVMDGMQLYAYVREQVRLNAPQTPEYSNIRLAGHEVGGDFLFVRR
jgi:uncharacterized caspase-like protein